MTVVLGRALMGNWLSGTQLKAVLLCGAVPGLKRAAGGRLGQHLSCNCQSLGQSMNGFDNQHFHFRHGCLLLTGSNRYSSLNFYRFNYLR